MLEAYEITLKSKRLVTEDGIFEEGFRKLISPDHPKFAWFKSKSAFNFKKTQVPAGMAKEIGAKGASDEHIPQGNEGELKTEDIKALELSNTAEKALREAGINTIPELKQVADKASLLEIKGIGESTADAIMKALTEA
jgi:DNA-directed RNA polymerase alpha subunit